MFDGLTYAPPPGDWRTPLRHDWPISWNTGAVIIPRHSVSNGAGLPAMWARARRWLPDRLVAWVQRRLAGERLFPAILAHDVLGDDALMFAMLARDHSRAAAWALYLAVRLGRLTRIWRPGMTA